MNKQPNAGQGRRWRPAAVLALASAFFVGSPGASAADPVAPSAPGKERAVTLESVPGSPIKRVVLSAKAAGRLDVKTGVVSEQTIARTQMVGGIVVDPSAAGGASRKSAGKNETDASGATPELMVRVALSPPEWERLAKDKPARVFPLETRAGLAADLTAQPSGRPPQDNAKSGMLILAYVVPPGNTGLVIGDRVRVEVPLEGSLEKQKVVPYSAIHYDAKGDAWVYVSTAPLAFMRQRVTLDRVAGNLALLSTGPEVGTPVATVGVSLLYGAEIFGK